MTPLDFARMRVKAFLEEVARMKEAEFPYPHSRMALDALTTLFEKRLNKLSGFDESNDPAIVRRECEISLRDLFEYTRVLGFVLRSTNVRNAFEVYRPLLRLARALLEASTPEGQRTTRLLLSSEWDYSPFVYPEKAELPGFVLIGLPAHESSNPFLIPLAGHELGHSLWAKKQYNVSFRQRITNEVLTYIRARWSMFLQVFPSLKINQSQLTTDLFAVETWKTAVILAGRQLEESFCDFVGIRVFGNSYLNAFAYLLSPNVSGPRSTIYPKMHDRVRNMLSASAAYGITPRVDYASFYEDNSDLPVGDGDKFLLSIADAARQAIVPELIALTDQVITGSGIEKPSDEEALKIFARLRLTVPAEHSKKLSDIINAGWIALEDERLWKDMENVKHSKGVILKELVLKSIEVFEIEQIIREAV